MKDVSRQMPSRTSTTSAARLRTIHSLTVGVDRFIQRRRRGGAADECSVLAESGAYSGASRLISGFDQAASRVRESSKNSVVSAASPDLPPSHHDRNGKMPGPALDSGECHGSDAIQVGTLPYPGSFRRSITRGANHRDGARLVNAAEMEFAARIEEGWHARQAQFFRDVAGRFQIALYSRPLHFMGNDIDTKATRARMFFDQRLIWRTPFHEVTMEARERRGINVSVVRTFGATRGVN